MKSLETEIFYPKEIAESDYLTEDIEDLPITELPFDILGGEKEAATIPRVSIDSILPIAYEAQQGISIDNPAAIENSFIDGEVPLDEMNAFENEASPIIENNIYYEEVFNHDYSSGAPAMFMAENKYNETVSPYYGGMEVAKSSGDSFCGDDILGSESLGIEAAANFSVFENNEGQKSKEVHIHNEVPAINIEFSGNIEKEVDFEGLLRNMQKRIREEMESGADFSYSS